MNQAETDLMFMDWAWRASERSHALRLKVGCVVTKGDSVLAYGWNGMPAGYDNKCEHAVLGGYTVGSNYVMQLSLKTNPEVSHAELNAIGKLAESTVSATGASMYSTHSPCMKCALLIQRTGITELVYDQQFRTDEGLYLLQKRGINIRKI